MSSMDGAGVPGGPAEPTYVLQVYPRLPLQDSATCCTLQVTAAHTATTVIQDAVAALGLDVHRSYRLLEQRESGAEVRPLGADDRPVERYLLWPRHAWRWHPQSQGYHFVLQHPVEEGGAGGDEDHDDLCRLPALSEEAVLEALRQRFLRRKIYTYVGGVLVAVNPVRFLPACYNPKYVRMYENQPLGALSPHVFAMVDVAYRAMLARGKDQVIVVSGESGSGKTESSSYLVHCLTALSQKRYASGVERILLGAGPVLEAFGNAKTARNDNSSRFGKLVQLNYLESGVIRGAVVEKYLLETRRVVRRERSERNYHVFYYLLVGASKEEQTELHLLQPHEYLYLHQEDFSVEEEDQLRHQHKRLHQAMEMVGFLASTKKLIFSVLSAVLYLGNVTYAPSEDGQVLEAGPANVLSALSDLLKVKKEQLVDALTQRSAAASDHVAVSPYTLQEAAAARDSMATSLYAALFDWIVLHVNHRLLNRRDMEESVTCLSIGIVDVFGFENLQTNGFEQLCINYAAEELQHYFSHHVFQLQQEEYLSEGISWYTIGYRDNVGCIDMISKAPTGLLHLLDEECNLHHATDDSLLEKFTERHTDNPLFVSSATMEPAFVVQHYAGRVKYQIKGFRERNTDHMHPDVVSLLRRSGRAFLRQLVASSPVALFRWGVLRATVRIIAIFKTLARQRASAEGYRRRSRKSLRELRRNSAAMHRLSNNSLTLDFSFDRSDEHPLDVFEDIFANYEKRKKNRGSRQKQLIPKKLVDCRSLKHIMELTSYERTSTLLHHPNQRKKPPSVSGQFQASLCRLLQMMGRAEPSFIRCIRSNAEKKPLLFDDGLVLHQIKYTGLLETIRIQEASYGAKYTFQEFLQKFRVLLPAGTGAPEGITELFQRMGLDPNTYQMGKTKVFLKESERQRLQDTLNRAVMGHIVTLQRWFRSCLLRKHFLQKIDAALIIQRCWREFYENNQNRAAVIIQTAWRSSLKNAGAIQRDAAGETTARNRPGRQSSERRELKRQAGVEGSPNRSRPPESLSDCGGTGGEVKREGRGSPPPLNRPLSLPLDPKHGRDDHDDGAGSPAQQSSSLQRYTHMDSIQEKGAKWRERRSGDESSPELRPARERPGLQRKGKSMSVDELLTLSSSGSDSSSSKEVRVRFRKRPSRKRRLAYARSGLMFNCGGSKESEFWSFPLPPISPQGARLKNSFSSVDVRRGPAEPEVKLLSEGDGARFSLPAKPTNEGSGRSGSSHSQPTTPERPWFLSRILKKKPPRDSQQEADKEAPLAVYNPPPYRKPAQNSGGGPRRNPTIRISRATRAEQWNASLDREITDSKELLSLDEFLGNQVNELNSRIKELSATESIFLSATMEFRDIIKCMYSFPKPQICYKDLMKSYMNKVNRLATGSQQSEVTLVVNLFQSVLDGFIRGQVKREEAEPAKSTKKTKKRRKKEKCMENPLDHMFSTYQVNIMQSCDLCGSYIWGMEKAYMCSACKLICHKKCLTKVITDCSTRCARKDDSMPGSLHFGVQVGVLTSKSNPVPQVVEMLLMYVEINGLYTEGIYRKSGSACRARELHQILETNPESACLENYPIHTITGLVKRWLRELPDPLMTFNLYYDFLHAAELPEKAERMRAIYRKVDELPPANYDTLERLIFHLVKVAKEEEHNRMSANSLAIVFAPCIMRSPDANDPFLGIKDVSKTTQCVEVLITEQFRRYTEKMTNIKELEYAEALAVNQLKLKRQNTVIEKPELQEIDLDEEAEMILIERIKSIKQEKEDLAYRLPELEQEDNDNLDSESSMSSDSLAEDLWSLDWEGKVSTTPLTSRKLECPPKPQDLADRVKSLMSQRDDATTWTPPGARTRPRPDATPPPLSPEAGQAGTSQPSPSNAPQLKEKPLNGSLYDLDIPFIDADV